MNELATQLDFGMETAELLQLLIPYIIVQYGLSIYCIVDILRKGTANLSKGWWIVICFFSGIIGPILYFTMGRRKDV